MRAPLEECACGIARVDCEYHRPVPRDPREEEDEKEWRHFYSFAGKRIEINVRTAALREVKEP